MRGLLTFLFLFIMSVHAGASSYQDSEYELQSMIAAIRLAESQTHKIDNLLFDIQNEKQDIEAQIQTNLYDLARYIHITESTKRKPINLLFLIYKDNFFNHYKDLRKSENIQHILSHKLSLYHHQLDQLQRKKDDIENYLEQKKQLSLSVHSLLAQIKEIPKKQNTISQDLTAKLEDLKNKSVDLNSFLKTLLNDPNLEYHPPTKPIFSLPVSGVIRQNDNGISIQTISGNLVTAPANGYILFADSFKNLGKVVILDHGYGYVSILTGLKTLFISQGDILSYHAPLGLIGGDEWNKGKNNAILYYQLRYNNKSINPIKMMTGL